MLRTLSSFLQTIAMLSQSIFFFQENVLVFGVDSGLPFPIKFRHFLPKRRAHGKKISTFLRNNFQTGINKISVYLLLSYLDCEKFSWFKIGLDIFVLGKIFHLGKPNGSVRDNIDKRMKVIHAWEFVTWKYWSTFAITHFFLFLSSHDAWFSSEPNCEWSRSFVLWAF